MGTSLDRYLDEIGRSPLLTREEELRLARLIRTRDDERARERLVTGNLRFVVAMARRYTGRGLPLEDLVNEGNLGMLKAARRFDASRGVRFVTYAAWWIRQSILAALARTDPVVPPGVAPARPRSGDGAEALERRGGRGRELSLDGRVRDADGSTLGELLADVRTPGPEGELHRSALRDALEAGLAFLPVREARVLRLSYGLEDHEPWPLDRIGRELGLSPERVRELRTRGLARLREGPRRDQLRTFSR